MADVVLIAAVAENGVIGKGGAIPWRLPQDMRRFKALTLGHLVVMGRKTWNSLPKKPLPGRRNIVVTRQKDWQGDGATAVGSVEDALAGDGTIFVIGGGEIYRAALPFATRIELTEIHRAFAGDAHFPAPDRTRWRERNRESHTTPEGLRYSFVTLERI
ncbi:MAG TPA: dihydrofolate reductase [Rhizomicrobium sp.]|jgi:dihydrofolate reductase|nr:dihydrofolate reductase [Rhizomicrobium sp.]